MRAQGHGINTDVSQYAKQIVSWGVGKAPSNACLPAGARVVKLALSSLRASGSAGLVRLGANQEEVFYEIDVPTGAIALRVTMNAGKDADASRARSSDIDLYVYKGRYLVDGNVVQGQTGFAENGTGQFAACEIRSGVPSVWQVQVRRKDKDGEGDVQVTATYVVGR